VKTRQLPGFRRLRAQARSWRAVAGLTHATGGGVELENRRGLPLKTFG